MQASLPVVILNKYTVYTGNVYTQKLYIYIYTQTGIVCTRPRSPYFSFISGKFESLILLISPRAYRSIQQANKSATTAAVCLRRA